MSVRTLCLAALLFSAAAFSAELFVSPRGSDKNPGSAKAPFATIAKAAAAANPGDTVKIGPGVYREQITFTRSGKEGAPITFAGTRGAKGEFLTIVEAPGKVLDKWAPASEIGPQVWKTPLAKRPDLIMMDGAMITFVNPSTMKLAPWKRLPKEIDDDMLWDKFGPKCKRLPGLDLLKLPAGIQVKHQYFRKRKELFWPTIGNVLSGWHGGYLYVRFADDRKPEEHLFTASYGEGFAVTASHLIFRDLHMRGSRRQMHLKEKSSHNLIESCLLMHGGARIIIDETCSFNTVRGNILTTGFTRSDLFKLRSRDDMRGGLLYLVFKYIIGYSLSDDVGARNYGRNTVICNNLVLQGLIGISANGQCEVYGNVVREMSSVGIVTGPTSEVKCHHNLVMNCGIPLRIHSLRGKVGKREEYHYNNLFVQAPHGGSQIFVHSESYRRGPDAVNFEKVPGKKNPVYKKDPPAPVDAGKIYIYHNTFWGGNDEESSFTVGRFARRFRMVMPFFVVNNIYKYTPGLEASSHELPGPNLLYVFDGKVSRMPPRDPAVSRVNKVLDEKASQTIWNKHGLPGLPDVTLAPNSPALEAGVDISKPFTVNGKTFPAFPGFKHGYFKGKAPAAGALQQGESEQRFIDMHNRAEAAVKMLSELKKNTAARRR